VVPLWYTHHHTNTASDDVILFAVSDAPLLRGLELYREEAVDRSD